MKTFLKIAAVMTGVAALAAGGWLYWLKLASRSTPVGQAPLSMLDAAALDVFRGTFNAHAQEARLLLLLSPT